MSFKNADYEVIQAAIGYDFTQRDLLTEALDTTGLRTTESNQRLAMLGDALLKMILLDDWYASGKTKLHGNNLVSTIGSNVNLAATARGSGLEEHVIVHPGHRGNVSDKTLATTVEAVLGAIYLDSEKDTDSVSRAMIMLGLKPSI